MTAPISKNAGGVDADLQSIEMIEKILALSYKKNNARRLTEARVYRVCE